MPTMFRDHLCPQNEGTICSRVKKEAISARIVRDYLCPKCKGLLVSEKLRNFCACKIGFFSFAYVAALFTISFVVFCFDYFMCVRVCLV